MSSLRQKLNDLASTFADSVLDAIRTASIDELTGQASGGRRAAAYPAEAAGAAVGSTRGRRRGGRLARRSAGDIAGVIERITGLLRASPKGLRAEEIRQKLGLEAKELPRPLKEAVDGGRLGKTGQKRATTYFLKNGGGGAAVRGAVAARKGKAAGGGRRPASKGRRAKRAAKK